MKKTLFAGVFLFSTSLYCYFDAGFNYTTGKNGYAQQDIYLLLSKGGWWIKPSYLSWKDDSNDRFNSFFIKGGFEKQSYIVGFVAGFTPEKSDYKNLSIGGDITFSLNPTSSPKRRIAGPNSTFVARSAEGVSQIDLGSSVMFINHTYTALNTDLKELNISVFAGAKIFLTQISANYSFSTYNKQSLANLQKSPVQKLTGISSVFPVFIKSNFNVRVEATSSPLLTPYISYNRVKTKSNESIDIYAAGTYIDLAMVGLTLQFETYKDTHNKTQRYLSLSAGLRF